MFYLFRLLVILFDSNPVTPEEIVLHFGNPSFRMGRDKKLILYDK